MTIFENDLWVTHRETVHVSDPSAKNEGIVVQAEVGCIQEKNFADIGSQTGLRIRNEIHFFPFCGFLYQLPKFPETFHRRKAVRLQNQFRFEKLNLMERMTVSVGARRAFT